MDYRVAPLPVTYGIREGDRSLGVRCLQGAMILRCVRER